MCRSKLQILRFLLGEGSSSVVPSSTSPEVPTGLEGGPTVECRLKSSMRPMFAAMQLIWLALWFWSALFQRQTRWVHHYFVQTLWVQLLLNVSDFLRPMKTLRVTLCKLYSTFVSSNGQKYEVSTNCIVLYVYYTILNCIVFTYLILRTPISSFSAACWSTGLHHIHWLQHFFPLFARLHCLLHFTAVSHVRIMNACPTIDRCESIESWCVAAHSMCRKELITKLHNFVHLNLCIALALGLLLFLTGIQTATANVVRANRIYIF